MARLILGLYLQHRLNRNVFCWPPLTSTSNQQLPTQSSMLLFHLMTFPLYPAKQRHIIIPRSGLDGINEKRRGNNKKQGERERKLHYKHYTFSLTLFLCYFRLVKGCTVDVLLVLVVRPFWVYFHGRVPKNADGSDSPCINRWFALATLERRKLSF